jgi:hypothetical protein
MWVREYWDLGGNSNMIPSNKDPETVMVLRTVYLPRDLDVRLREIAFKEGKSKNEVIREILYHFFDPAATDGGRSFRRGGREE